MNSIQNVRTMTNPNPALQAVALAPANPLGLPAAQEWNQIKEIAASAVKSGMLPSAIKTAEAASIIALKSRELGIPLMVGFAHIHCVNGKPAMSAELIQAQARKNLPGLIFNIIETTNEKCVVRGQRPERGSVPMTVSFTIEDARRANLTGKDVWKQYPAAMLRSRAITACLRILCPDALMGISYTPEELGLDAADDSIETTARAVETAPAPKEAPKPEPTPQPEPAAQPEPLPAAAESPLGDMQAIFAKSREAGISDEEMSAHIRGIGVTQRSEFKPAHQHDCEMWIQHTVSKREKETVVSSEFQAALDELDTKMVK
jgi:hypothetical protein